MNAPITVNDLHLLDEGALARLTSTCRNGGRTQHVVVSQHSPCVWPWDSIPPVCSWRWWDEGGRGWALQLTKKKQLDRLPGQLVLGQELLLDSLLTCCLFLL
jgi:hypothetical protein